MTRAPPEDLDRVPRLCYFDLAAAGGSLTKAELASKTGYSTRHIERALGTLVGKGLIQGWPRSDGANEYRLRNGQTTMQTETEHTEEA